MTMTNEQMLETIRLYAIGAHTDEARDSLKAAYARAMSVIGEANYYKRLHAEARRTNADLSLVIDGLREELAAKREASTLLKFDSAIASRAVSAENAKPTDGSGVHAASGCGERRDVNANAGERRPRPGKQSPLRR